MNTDDSNPVNLMDQQPEAGNSNDEAPAWSPDGSKIVFMSDRLGRLYDLFVMNPDGSEVVQLSRELSKSTIGHHMYPAWSPLPRLITPSAVRALSWGQVKVGGW